MFPIEYSHPAGFSAHTGQPDLSGNGRGAAKGFTHERIERQSWHEQKPPHFPASLSQICRPMQQLGFSLVAAGS